MKIIIRNKNIATLIAGLYLGVSFSINANAEDALRDGQRNPTLLYEQGGQPKRVSDTSPLPVVVGGSLVVSSTNPIQVTAAAAIPIVSAQTLNVAAPNPLPITAPNPLSIQALTPLAVTFPGAVPITSSNTLNVAAPNPLPVTASAPIPVTAAGVFPISSTNTLNVAAPNPLTVLVQNQPSSMTVTIANQSNPIPVTVSSQSLPVSVTVVGPIPSSTATLSIGAERIGSGTITLITPASGKRISIKGAAIMMETSTGGEADIRFSGGQVVFKVYRGDQSGAVIPVYREGSVNEIVQAVVSGIAGGAKVFFVVNYEER